MALVSKNVADTSVGQRLKKLRHGVCFRLTEAAFHR